jgi:hypothetical protein
MMDGLQAFQHFYLVDEWGLSIYMTVSDLGLVTPRVPQPCATCVK